MVKELIASERPLEREITGHLGSVGVRLRSLGPRSCTVEHEKQVRVSTDTKLMFRWEGTPWTIPVRVHRSRLGQLLTGGTGYHTTLELLELPVEVRQLIDRFVDCASSPASSEPTGPDGRGIRA